ncbi:hypothetical protein [Plantactinospora sp. WMMB782]|uniref:hypothetical protein n=1 Tax=Plantactinospora sp. WMMB782 TaxID=3404121 RepID=UPI003B9298E8
MNPNHARELLERAAASVTPSETDPASRLVSLGRRSVQRRRRAWGTAGGVAVAAAVSAAMALPLGTTTPTGSKAAGAPGTTVRVGDLSVTVPEGWRTSRVDTFEPCTAQPRTIYLAARWRVDRTKDLRPGGIPPQCTSEGQTWMAVVGRGVGKRLSPSRLVVEDKQVIQVEQNLVRNVASMWAYHAFSEGEALAPTVFISGDEEGREQLLERVTWPAGPPAPASGGLALPARISSAVSEKDGPMVAAADAVTVTRIRTKLAELRETVPAGEECTLQKPGAIGISLGEVTVVLGDATCPQAISTGGGRVRVPADLGKDLLDLIVASDRAATEAATND